MYKKKIVGLLVFTLLLTLYLGYPSLQEWNFGRKINAMVKAEEYQRVYDLLSEKELDPSSQQFLNLLKAKIVLNTHDARGMIDKLVENKEREALQRLVDEFGLELENYLLAIDQMEGIVYEDEVREHLMFLYAFLGENLDRAMELRGETDKIDIIYLAYLSKQDDLTKLLEIYEDVPEYLLPSYYNIIVHNVIYMEIMNDPNNAKTLLDGLMEYDYPEGVLLNIGKEFAGLGDRLWMGLNEHPFFTENIYYDFFYTHSKLNNPEKREETLLALKSDKYKDIQLRDKLLDLAENATNVYDMFSVSSNAELLYSIRVDDSNQYYLFDLNTQIKRELDYHYIYHVSPNRSYMAVMDYSSQIRKIKVYDEDHNLKVELDAHTQDKIIDYWINDWELVLLKPDRDERQILNVKTGEIRSYSDEKPYTVGLEPRGQGFRLWSVNEERYIGVDIKDNQFHYVVRDRETHQEKIRIPLAFDFLGSCDEYIYGIRTEEEFINILVKQSIKTGEVITLPFYTVKAYTGYPRFIIMHY